MSRSTSRFVAVVLGLLVVLLVFSASHYFEARERANRAASQAEQVRSLVDQIQSLANRPLLAVTQNEDVQQISGLIEASAGQAGISSEQIDSINAQDARRVGQSPYYRMPTRINLVGVELPNLVQMIASITAGGGIQVDDFRIAAPHSEVVGSTWNTEFTLSYLLYDSQQDLAGP